MTGLCRKGKFQIEGEGWFLPVGGKGILMPSPLDWSTVSMSVISKDGSVGEEVKKWRGEVNVEASVSPLFLSPWRSHLHLHPLSKKLCRIYFKVLSHLLTGRKLNTPHLPSPFMIPLCLLGTVSLCSLGCHCNRAPTCAHLSMHSNKCFFFWAS